MNYLYIKKFSDVNGYELPNYKKIGIASNVEDRRRQLSGTKAPIFIETVAAWEFPEDNARHVEQALHGLLLNKRTDGEWFHDEEDTLVEAVSNLMKAFNVSVIDASDNEEKEMKSKRDINLATIMDEYITKVKAKCKIDFAYKCNASEITMLSAPNTFYLQMRKTTDPRLVIRGKLFSDNFDKVKQLIGREEAGKREGQKSYDCAYWDRVTPQETANLLEGILSNT